MYQTTETLKYTGAVVNVLCFDSGLKSYENIEYFYKDDTFRNKVICRCNLMDYLIGKYFSSITIENYRDAILLIVNRQIQDVKQISNALVELASNDEIFSKFLNEAFYFRDDSISFGDYILNTIAIEIAQWEARYRSFFRGKREFVICVSDGYLYFSVQDENIPVNVLGNARCEVISIAKNWRGEFNHIRE